MKFLKILIVLLTLTYIFNNIFITKNNTKTASLESITSVKKIDSLIFNKGEKLYTSNCANCHAKKGHNHNYLNNIFERVDKKYFIVYLTKQDSLIEIKDKYAIGLKENYGNLGNSHNFNFNSLEINSIIEFLK